MKSQSTATSDPLHSFEDLSPQQARDIDELCDYFEHQLYTGGQPRIESLLGGFQEPQRTILLRELLWLELETYHAQGANLSKSEYCRRFAGHETLVREIFAAILPAETVSVIPEPHGPGADRNWPEIPHYRILRELSHGGMGTVYEAIHTRLGSRVAIKVLREKLAGSVEAEAWFEREMKVIGTLSHPNIVAARDAGTFNGQHYLVMEYVEGLDLGDVVSRLRTLAVGDACEIARAAAMGLEHAHEHRLVHRDIKPKNILLGRLTDGQAQVKVTDFGLASLLGYAALRDPQVPYARIAGTFAFMAPEQYWERSADIRSDIYGLGCTLYCLLMGQPPFPPSRYVQRADLMEAHRSQPVPDIRRLRPDVSEPLRAILLKMLAKSPADRFQCPRDVAEALFPMAEDHDLTGLLERATESVALHGLGMAGLMSDLPQAAGPAPLASHRETSRVSGQERDDTLSWDGAPEAPPKAPNTGPPPLSPNSLAEPASERAEPAGGTERTGNRLLAGMSKRWQVLAAVTLGLLVVIVWLGIIRLLPPAEVDLLARIDPVRDALRGQWHRDGTSLVSPDAAEALLQIPYPLPEEYRLEVQAERLTGGRLVIGLIWQGRKVPVVLDAMRVVPSQPQDHPPTAISEPEIPASFDYRGPADTHVCIVRREGIVVARDGQVQFTCWPDRSLDGPSATWMTQQWTDPQLMLGTHVSQYRFPRIVLRPLVR
jgi:serine/threonine protein kinase